MKITFIFSCSGMFPDVPACSGMFLVPGFIDAQKFFGKLNCFKRYSILKIATKWWGIQKSKLNNFLTKTFFTFDSITSCSFKIPFLLHR